jgi:cellulose synthase/poly-beta-1,6-N-acetylglucosamine synthase-like glycosyltransferase
MLFWFIIVGSSLAYLILQIQYVYTWNKIPVTDRDISQNALVPVTVVVVARNEEDTISACLHGLLAQDYPKTLIDLLVIDDHSTDHTFQKLVDLKNPAIRLLRLKDYPEFIHAPAYKKSAITLAVHQSNTDFIIVTDADCVHDPSWASSVMKNFLSRQAIFQTSPVLITESHSLLEKMQEAELLSYALITGAGIESNLHMMANGANMAFTKSAFMAVNGYEGNYQFASGDDMFLIEKMHFAFPDQIHFAKSLPATVFTKAKSNWDILLNQRVRWASKNMGLKSKTISNIWVFVGLYHFLIFFMLILALFQWRPLWPLLLLVLVKWTADYLLLRQATLFFKRKNILRYFLPLQFLFFIYIFRLTWALLAKRKTDWQANRQDTVTSS